MAEISSGTAVSVREAGPTATAVRPGGDNDQTGRWATVPTVVGISGESEQGRGVAEGAVGESGGEGDRVCWH